MLWKKKGFSFAFFAFCLMAGRLGAQSSTAFPSLEADPQAEAFDRQGREWEELAEIALWASTVGLPESGQRAAWKRRLQEAARELAAAPDLPGGERERGEYALAFCHRRFLKTYAEKQTRLDQVLATGRYNCVSSAALYLILGIFLGLDVRGVMTRDHAFATVWIDEGEGKEEKIDVETTNPYGFDPGSRREFFDGFGKLTGFAYVPARNYRDRAAVSPVELLSLILSNRIVELEARGRYADAVSLAVNRAALLRGLPNPASSPLFGDPEKDLLDRLFNFGAALLQRGREAEALEWSVLASGRFPAPERWEDFCYTALHNLCARSIQANQANQVKKTAAREALFRYGGVLTAEHRDALEGMLLDAEIAQSPVEEAEAALAALEGPEARRLLSGRRREELRTFVLLREGERRAAACGAGPALLYLEEAMRRYGTNPRLESARRVLASNRVAEIHNEFARRYNQGDREGARLILEEGLKEFPGNRQLTADQRQAFP